MYIPVLAQLADTFFCSKWELLLEADCIMHWVGVLLLAVNPWCPRILTTALVTEWQSCGMCAILPPELMRYESTGLPVPSIEIRILDVVDGRYLASNTPPHWQEEVCTAAPINSASERTPRQCRSSRFLGHHCLHCQLSPLRLRWNSYGDYKLRIAQYPL